MRLLGIGSDCMAVMGIFVCFALTSVLAQMPTKEAHLSGSSTAAEETPTSTFFPTIESGLRRDLEAHPDSAPILYQLGQVLRFENRPKESLEIYTQAANLQKPDADELRSVALDYVLLDDYNDAIHWLGIARSMAPSNVNILYSLGRCYFSQSRFDDAKTMFLQVLQIKPDHLKAEENLGLIYDLVDNQPEKAETALRKTVEWAGQETTDEWPFLDLGGFLLNHGRAAEAIPVLRRAATIAAKSAVCHEKLGLALVAAKDITGGVEELATASQLDPKNPKIHFELGRAYRQEGALDKSRAEFELSESLYGYHNQE